MNELASALFVASIVAFMWVAARARRRRWWAVPAVLAAISFIVTPTAFALGKWLGRLFMPPALVWLALLVLSCWALRARWRGATALVVLFVFYWGSTVNCISLALASWLEAPFSVQQPVAHYDAVAVLGGGTSYRPWGEAQLSMSGDRMATAAALYHARRTDRILCSGGVIVDDGWVRDGPADAIQVLRDLGVPDGALEKVSGPRNTSEELAALAALAKERGWRRVGIVSSAWHLRRTMRHAQRQGLDADPVPSDFLGGRPVWGIEEILPSAIALYRTQVVAWELLGMAVGR